MNMGKRNIFEQLSANETMQRTLLQLRLNSELLEKVNEKRKEAAKRRGRNVTWQQLVERLFVEFLKDAEKFK